MEFGMESYPTVINVIIHLKWWFIMWLKCHSVPLNKLFKHWPREFIQHPLLSVWLCGSAFQYRGFIWKMELVGRNMADYKLITFTLSCFWCKSSGYFFHWCRMSCVPFQKLFWMGLESHNTLRLLTGCFFSILNPKESVLKQQCTPTSISTESLSWYKSCTLRSSALWYSLIACRTLQIPLFIVKPTSSLRTDFLDHLVSSRALWAIFHINFAWHLGCVMGKIRLVIISGFPQRITYTTGRRHCAKQMHILSFWFNFNSSLAKSHLATR